MDRTQQLLIELLRCSLWGVTFEDTITQKDFKEVLRLAEEQTIFGLVFETLKAIQPCDMDDKMPIFEAIGVIGHISQQNQLVNKELKDFSKNCSDEGIDYIVVKGQTLANLYQNPQIRQAGDIDFLVRDCQIEKISSLFATAKIPANFPEKEFAFAHNGITYELHTRLIDFGKKKSQKKWEELILEEWENPYYAEVDGCAIRTLSPTINAIYVFIHLFFHFITAGVSMRQMCDWAMVLHHYNKDIDRRLLNEILTQFDLQVAYRAFEVILVQDLGLTLDELPVPLKDGDKRWRGQILKDICRGGNFGKKNHHAKSAIGYKMETLCQMLRNSVRYYKLAPTEMRMMIPKMLRINLKLIGKI